MPGRPPVVALVPPQQPARRGQLRDRLLRGVYRVGWRIAPRLPSWLVSLIISAVSWVALLRNGVYVRTLRRNLAHTTGTPVGDDLVRAGLKSYRRTFYEVLALPGWSEAEIRRRVSAVNEPLVRAAHA